MQEFKYQLQKEDYMDWIHWNVGRQNLKKVQRITLIVYVVFLVLYIGGNIAAKRPPQAMLTTVIMMTALGIFMFYNVTAKHQEQVVWKRSGLKKLEKQGGFPTVHLTVKEDCITMEVPGEVCKDYSYADIKEIREIDRLFLLAAATDNTWQFVAKSAFESEEQMNEFKAFMEEKIEDAKANPEKYRKVEKKEERAAGDGTRSLAGSAGSGQEDGESEEEYIEPVDTSNMGKIGKMAHIMAALAAKEAAESKAEDLDAEVTEPGTEVKEPGVRAKESGVEESEVDGDENAEINVVETAADKSETEADETEVNQ